MADVVIVDLFQRLALALGIGFLVGVERGWRHRAAPEGSRAAGLRTHAILGLSGGVSGALLPAIGPLGFAAITVAFAAAFIVFKVLESQHDRDISATGTIGGLLVYALGAYAIVGDPRLAAAAGVTLTGLLAFKYALHDWLDKLTWKELRSALLILAATAIALPLLPVGAVDPWGIISPRELWILTILVASASFAGYVAVRVLGDKLGVLAGAAAGALVSSTVVTAELGRRVQAGQTSAAVAAAAASLAAAVSISRVGLFVAAVAAPAFSSTAPAFVLAIVIFASGAWLLGRLDHRAAQSITPVPLHSPLDLGAVARFALLLGAVIAIGRLLTDAFGQAGLLPFAAIAGAVDVDAVTLAVSSLVRVDISAQTAAAAIATAVAANTLAKGGIAVAIGGWRYGTLYLLVAAFAMSAATVGLLLISPWIGAVLHNEPSPAGADLG